MNEELYDDYILDHYECPYHKGHIECPTCAHSEKIRSVAITFVWS